MSAYSLHLRVYWVFETVMMALSTAFFELRHARVCDDRAILAGTDLGDASFLGDAWLALMTLIVSAVYAHKVYTCLLIESKSWKDDTTWRTWVQGLLGVGRWTTDNYVQYRMITTILVLLLRLAIYAGAWHGCTYSLAVVYSLVVYSMRIVEYSQPFSERVH